MLNGRLCVKVWSELLYYFIIFCLSTMISLTALILLMQYFIIENLIKISLKQFNRAKSVYAKKVKHVILVMLKFLTQVQGLLWDDYGSKIKKHNFNIFYQRFIVDRQITFENKIKAASLFPKRHYCRLDWFCKQHN